MWKYIILEQKSPLGDTLGFGLAEAYYNEGEDMPHSWSQNNMAPFGDDREELLEVIEMMRRDAERSDIYVEFNDKIMRKEDYDRQLERLSSGGDA